MLHFIVKILILHFRPRTPLNLYNHFVGSFSFRNMYIFGGFNGAFFNDVLSYTHGTFVSQKSIFGKLKRVACDYRVTTATREVKKKHE